MKVFLDTNVIVSAVATRGLCADVLREVLVSHRLVVSPTLFKELKKVLRGKLGISNNIIFELIELLRQDAILSTSSVSCDVNLKDQDDLIILSSALKGKAEYFITGDLELLKLKKVEKMEIISPRMFWEKLKSGLKDNKQ